MKRLKSTIMLLALFLVLGCSSLFAQTVVKATLEGGGEVPKVATAMYGNVVYVISADRTTIDFRLTVKNIGTQVTNAHIHLGPEGLAASPVLPLYSARTQSAFSGTLSGTLTAADLIKFPDVGLTTFDILIDNIIRGNTYTNVHTTKVPGGEIRGQNKAVGLDD